VRARVLSGGPVIAELEVTLGLRLPRRLRSDRRGRLRSTRTCQVRTVVRLAAGVDRIELRTEVWNRVRDHRLRVRYPVPGPAEGVRAEGSFMVVRRPLEPEWRGHGWREVPTLTHHTSGAVAMGELAVFTRGCPEYQAVRHEGGVDVAITLLRCVDAISRSDLDVRPGHVGPPYPTPGAQGLGRHVFEHAIALGADTDDDLALLQRSQDYRFGLLVVPAGVRSPVTLLPELDRVILSAWKAAEDGDGLILRVFAAADGEGGTVRTTHPSIALTPCRLDESALESDAATTTAGRGLAAVVHDVPAGAIGTYRVRPRAGGLSGL
jgi:alpha-mannosidase